MGANDPDCRKPMVWKEMAYESETFSPDQTKHEADAVGFNKELFDWYKKFAQLRNSSKSIQLGNYTTLLLDDEKKLFAFSRKYGKEETIVIINRGNKTSSFNDKLLEKGIFKNVFSKTIVKQVIVEPMNIVVLSNIL